MSFAAMMLPEIDHEMAGLRSSLERVPEGQLDWTPHDRSFSMRGLVTHLATIPRWGVMVLEHNGLDMDPEKDRNEPVASVAAALEIFDAELASMRRALLATDDEALRAEWTFQVKGQVAFAMPRMGVMRAFVMNHMIHHRAQLGVYLRLLGVAVPSLYGPSADQGNPPVS